MSTNSDCNNEWSPQNWLSLAQTIIQGGALIVAGVYIYYTKSTSSEKSKEVRTEIIHPDGRREISTMVSKEANKALTKFGLIGLIGAQFGVNKDKTDESKEASSAREASAAGAAFAEPSMLSTLSTEKTDVKFESIGDDESSDPLDSKRIIKYASRLAKKYLMDVVESSSPEIRAEAMEKYSKVIIDPITSVEDALRRGQIPTEKYILDRGYPLLQSNPEYAAARAISSRHLEVLKDLKPDEYPSESSALRKIEASGGLIGSLATKGAFDIIPRNPISNEIDHIGVEISGEAALSSD